jgi:hypothetical protein
VLVLDANILIRAVLGSRVLFLLRQYIGHVDFLAPDTAFEEARERLPEILERPKGTVGPCAGNLGSPWVLWSAVAALWIVRLNPAQYSLRTAVILSGGN